MKTNLKTQTINRIFFSLVMLSFLFLLNGTVSAQKKWKDYLVTGSSMFVSGMLDGTIESISFHYNNGFKTRFPKINDQFWNPVLAYFRPKIYFVSTNLSLR